MRAFAPLASLIAAALLSSIRAAAAEEQVNLLANGDFETASSSGFTDWSCTVGNQQDWEDASVSPCPDAKSGKYAAALPSPSDGELLLFRQRAPAEKLDHEVTLHFELWGKSFAPDQLQVVVAFKQHGVERKVRDTHPGSGDWLLMERKFDLPQSAALDSVELQVIVRPGGEDPALVDAVRFWREEIAPKYALPKNTTP